MPDFSFVTTVAIFLGSLTGIWIFAKTVLPWLRRGIAKPTLHFRRMEFEIRWMRNNTNLAIFILSPELEVTEVNDALCHLLQVDRSDLMGRNWFGIIHQDDAEEVMEGWEKAVKTHSPYRKTQKMIVGETYMEFKVSGDPLIHGGRVAEFIGKVRPLVR